MMLFFSPIFLILLIYFLAAVMPAIMLVNYANNQPSLHHQPRGVMMHLLWSGVIAALIAMVLEWIMQYAVSGFRINTWQLYLFVGLIEEGAKLYILKKETWNSPYFETRYDGILYAVFVSLGFAAFENIKYVYAYGLDVAVSRALLAIPAHMAFAVFMGMFYGRARGAAYHNHFTASVYGVLCYIVPVALHCAYDSTASIETLPFILIVIVIYFIIFKLMKREAVSDRFV